MHDRQQFSRQIESLARVENLGKFLIIMKVDGNIFCQVFNQINFAIISMKQISFSDRNEHAIKCELHMK